MNYGQANTESCEFTYVHIYTCMCTLMHIYEHVYLNTCTHIHICIYAQLTHVHVCAQRCTCVHTCVHTHVHRPKVPLVKFPILFFLKFGHNICINQFCVFFKKFVITTESN